MSKGSASDNGGEDSKALLKSVPWQRKLSENIRNYEPHVCFNYLVAWFRWREADFNQGYLSLKPIHKITKML